MWTGNPPKPLRLCYWIPGWHRRSVFNYKPHYFHCGLVVWRLESTQNLIALLSRAFRPSCNSAAGACNLLPLTQILTPWPLFFFSLSHSPSLSLFLSICLSLYLSSFSQSNKVPVVQHPHHVHPLTPLITYSNEHFTPGNPPPHLQTDVDPKTGKAPILL